MITTSEKGYALVSVATLMGVMLVFIIVLMNSVLTGRNAEKAVQQNFAAVAVANAGFDKAIHCLNATNGSDCGGTFGANYVGETDVVVGAGTFTTAVTGAGASRDIVSVANLTGGGTITLAAAATTIAADNDMSFGYALQAGDGGAEMENNSSVAGTLYTNGNVICQGTNAEIDGDVYISLAGGIVDSCGINYHAHADNILDSDVGGDVYYDADPAGIAGTIFGGSANPGSTRPDEEPLPEVDLDFWRNSASEGGTVYGDQTPTDGASLGPVHIVGDLILEQNVDITLTGPVWVEGDVDLQNNASITLDAAYGESSTAILLDYPADTATYGKLTMVPNVALIGSGDPKSHIAIISTNTSTDPDFPAIEVRNNASGAIFFATNGLVRLYNNAGAKALAGYGLYIDQNAEVTYSESDLADLNFSNSPGGIWRIQSQTFRVVH